MIDFEVDIFNAVYGSVAPHCAVGGFKSIHTPVPTVFPTQTLFEMSNRTSAERNSTSPEEDFVIVTYEAHTYAQSKTECRKVFKALDDRMLQLGFTRVSGDYTPNQGNVVIHEYIARYRAEIDQNGIIYRRR